jgi:hypothetical protein
MTSPHEHSGVSREKMRTGKFLHREGMKEGREEGRKKGGEIKIAYHTSYTGSRDWENRGLTPA